MTALLHATLLLAAAAVVAPAQAEFMAGDDVDWDAAYTKAAAAVAKLSVQDNVNIVSGVGWNKGPCVGNTSPISAINYPQLCLQDGPLGIRFGTGNTAFTPGIQAASTWDRALMNQRGQFMGEEAKGCGVHVLLGPVGGPLGKHANGGRNWEGFGPDPYLTGVAMGETIQGMQGAGVQACAKHFILNEQELNRETMSSSVDDRTMHELYLWPFADAVKAGVASVMCSYNKVNGTWACENENILNNLLKDELGFRGYVMSDWNAQHTPSSAVSGMDMTMPGSDYSGKTILWGPQLVSAVNNSQVATTRLDDMATRVLAAWYLVGQDKGYPGINIKASVQSTHKDNVRAVARDGIVLLQNMGGILPLTKPKKLAIVGSAAVVNPKGMNACVDQGCNHGALGMGWGSGTSSYPYFVAPYDALKTRAAADYGTTVSRGDDNFAEGLYIDYRHFDHKNIEPRFPFGFGLSYTNFTYGDIKVTSTATSGAASGAVGPGGRADLFENVVTVTISLTNSGSVAGAEVPQLYLTLPSSSPAAPPKQLRGFDKLRLAPGAAGAVTFNLRRKDLSYWDVSTGWVVPSGTFTVNVGASSRDLRLKGTFDVA